MTTWRDEINNNDSRCLRGCGKGKKLSHPFFESILSGVWFNILKKFDICKTYPNESEDHSSLFCGFTSDSTKIHKGLRVIWSTSVWILLKKQNKKFIWWEWFICSVDFIKWKLRLDSSPNIKKLSLF